MTSLVPAFVDAEGVLAAWLNVQPGLVGPGNPMPLGVVFQHLRTGTAGTYALISIVGGTDDITFSYPRLQLAVYGPNRQATAVAAAALANTLRAVSGTPQTVLADERANDLPTPAVILAVDQVTGPTYVPGDEDQYVLTCLVMLTPSP